MILASIFFIYENVFGDNICPFLVWRCKPVCIGGIAPNQMIARSEFEVHRQIVTE